LDFLPGHLKITDEYYQKYESISKILDACPEILELVHGDLEATLKKINEAVEESYRYRYTTENVLRALIVQQVEGLSLRKTVVRIDDSRYLPRFVRLGNRQMLDFTHLDRLKNAIRPETWKEINRALARYAVSESLIQGNDLRLDTTAVETNIHYPTDSALLWDCYRVLGRLIDGLRSHAPSLVGTRRLRTRDVKRDYGKIARKAGKKGRSSESLKPLYRSLIGHVKRICDWSDEILANIDKTKNKNKSLGGMAETVGIFETEIDWYLQLARHVLWQASERVIHRRQISNEKKLYSIFEEHTELLKRGKAGKDIEFGHMIGIQQVRGRFITDYEVYESKPVEHKILRPALESHKELFGTYPDSLTADKGYWENTAALRKLEQDVSLVAIAKKGRRTEQEAEREHSSAFSAMQRFRAGIEGTISCLKRVFRLARCFNKGWPQFAATAGAAIFSHNLVTLARAPT